MITLGDLRRDLNEAFNRFGPNAEVEISSDGIEVILTKEMRNAYGPLATITKYFISYNKGNTNELIKRTARAKTKRSGRSSKATSKVHKRVRKSTL